MAQLPLAQLVDYEIDGINQWPSLSKKPDNNGDSSQQPMRREALLHLDPADRYHKVGSAAYRMGRWKFIEGFPNCTRLETEKHRDVVQQAKRAPQHNPWAFNPGRDHALPDRAYYPRCPDGWVALNGTWLEPQDLGKSVKHLVWLFDVENDPGETQDLRFALQLSVVRTIPILSRKFGRN